MKKAVAGALLVGAALRIAMLAGAGKTVTALVEEIKSGGFVSASLSLELSGEKEPSPTETPQPTQANVRLVQVEVTPQPTAAPSAAPAVQPEIIETTMLSESSIKNDTGFTVNVAALAEEGLSLHLSPDEPQILIIHTHSSEAYTQDPYDRYEESDASRTEDKSYNVIRVGDELAAGLEGCGLSVIHDREIYDYPSYTGSYTRCGEAIERYLAENPSIAIVIDLHRDAIGTGDTVYKTKAELPGMSCAQVMMLIGTGENGLYHPNWRENLKLALYMQNAAESKYPTLMRPVALKPERYNQQLTTGSMILEVGSSGNTLSEALLAIRLFAEAVGPALAELIE